MDNKEAQEIFKLYLDRRYGDRSAPQHYLSDLHIFFNHRVRSLYEKLACVTSMSSSANRWRQRPLTAGWRRSAPSWSAWLLKT